MLIALLCVYFMMGSIDWSGSQGSGHGRTFYFLWTPQYINCKSFSQRFPRTHQRDQHEQAITVRHSHITTLPNELKSTVDT